MDPICDIEDLVPGQAGGCPVCASAPPLTVVIDPWQQRRATASGPEPEPLVLHVPV